jgi:acyl-coenzyme A thioesterase PaaI-like protein
MNNTSRPIEAASADIPDGYAPHFRKSPLTAPWEPLYSKSVDGSIFIGLRIREAHCNSRGFANGGLISALADNAMGLSVIETMRQRGLERAAQGLTASLTVDFLGSAQIGQWLEVAPRMLKTGSSLGFVDCLVFADGQPVARGNATFRVYSPTSRD